jgi:AcrR family transcriptional regulator
MSSDPAAAGPSISPGLRRLWGLDTAPRPGQKPSLEIRQVVQAAISVADADGLEAVSMSRVARELGVTTMAVYRYVESKDELLELMLEVGAGDPPPLDPSLPWRQALRGWALNLAELYRTRPWSLDIPVPAPPRGPHQLAWAEQGLAALRDTPLAPGERMAAVMAVLTHARGGASLERQLTAAVGLAGDEASMGRDYAALLRQVLDPERSPEMSALFGSNEPDEDIDEATFGLERILDGIELLIRRREGELP